MADPTRLKKSETLEVRLPFAVKQAFMAQCQADGATASEAVRGFITERLTPPAALPFPAQAAIGADRVRRRWRVILAAAAAAAVAAVAAPSLARPSLPGEFHRLDIDGDGFLSPAEFAAGARLDVSVGTRRFALSATEQRAALLRAFETLDADRDGRVSLTEFAAR